MLTRCLRPCLSLVARMSWQSGLRQRDAFAYAALGFLGACCFCPAASEGAAPPRMPAL